MTSEGFMEFRDELEKEYELKEEIRTVVRELDQKSRELVSILQKIHTNPVKDKIAPILASMDAVLPDVVSCYQTLSSKIVSGQYFKYHDNYRFTNQRMVFVLAFYHYLKLSKLISIEEVAKQLGIGSKQENGFYMDLEDYLHGVLELTRELSRLSVNAVTAGDFNRPIEIKEFLTDLDAGFRGLNLKNDSLRRRYDALKYDVKKVEEVVYDLSIRKLLSSPSPAEDENSQMVE